MTHFSDALHIDVCRGCRRSFRRDEMNSARNVTKRKNARGWFCDRCSLIRGYKKRI